MTEGHQDVIDRSVAVNGLRLFTRRRPGRGPGVPLVLVHGIGGSLDSWEPLLAAMPDRDIIMIDTPGAGRSQVPLLPIPIAGLADCVAGAVRALGVARADVLGYSLGGLVTQELARRHPALVRKLVLVATIVGIGAKLGSLRARLTLLSTRRYRNRAAAAREIPILAGGRTARDRTVLAELVATRASHAPTLRGYHYQQLAVLGFSSRRWLPRLPFPTLVLQGTDDPVVLAANGRMLAGLIPNARLEMVPAAGHMLLFDESATVAPLIEDFLDS